MGKEKESGKLLRLLTLITLFSCPLSVQILLIPYGSVITSGIIKILTDVHKSYRYA